MSAEASSAGSASGAPFRTVGVVGAGTMGSGIATVMARAGLRTLIFDVDLASAGKGKNAVLDFLEKGKSLGKIDPAVVDQARDNVSPVSDLSELADCDVVIEAIFEDVSLKQRLFSDLESVCQEGTLFHTNTSTLSVTAIAGSCRRPERVVGTHYCNPAPLMKLVEVVRGMRTGDAEYARTHQFLALLSKQTVDVKDSPGFIVNRFLIPFENSCIRALSAGRGTVESIDRAIRGGLNYPMGTFQLLDIVGLDLHRAVSLSLYEQLRDPRFAPPPLVDQMIAAGLLGRKVGEGFYKYDSAGLFGT